MRFGSPNQGLPPLCLHLLRFSNLRPVDVLLALGNQSDGAFNANLQVLLRDGQPKIFFGNEVLGRMTL